MNFLEFVKNKQINESHREFINEAFKSSDVDKAIDLLTKLFKKNINAKVLRIQGTLATTVDGKPCTSILYLTYRKENIADQAFLLNFLNSGRSTEVYSISIFDTPNVAFKGTDKAKVTIFTMGASIVYFMPLIYHIINNEDYKVGKKDFDKYSKNIFVKESFRPFHIGALEYHIYEGLDYNYINEATERLTKAKKELHGKLKDSWQTYQDSKSKEDRAAFKDLESDYYAVVKAMKGGAEDLEDIDVEFKTNIAVTIMQGASEKKAQEEIEQLREDPESQWKQLRQYVKMVIKGTNPSCLCTGGPGLGKSFRIKKQLKAAGYQEGQNLWTIKGKCTPRQLYLALYEFQDKGDIVVIDDADALVGPKAPEDVINILKAALDSSEDDEGRLVSYLISGKLEDNDGNPVPKKFYYRGGVIVITNYNIGQIDTALKGRSFVAELNFTTEDILSVIEKLLPELGDGKWSKESKDKAFNFIKELSKDKNSEIELSIRTFGICTKIFESCSDDPDFTDEDCEKMIKKQLLLQARRGGKKW